VLPLKCKSSTKIKKYFEVLSDLYSVNSKKGRDSNALGHPREAYLLGSVLHLTEQLR